MQAFVIKESINPDILKSDQIYTTLVRSLSSFDMIGQLKNRYASIEYWFTCFHKKIHLCLGHNHQIKL